jgi:pimeloyl-ACP methyl ester carboxylesterase
MPDKTLNIGGVEWRYATGGRGREAVLMFHDAFGGAETMQGLASVLADEYRTIAPTVADVRTLREVCDAASAILDREHVARAHLFGGSFGGMLAQAFLKRRPAQVESLVLVGASPPNAEEGRRAERMSKLMRLLPFAITRGLMRLETLKQLDAPAPPEHTERVAQIGRRLGEYFDRTLTKRTLLSRLALSVEFNLRESYASGDSACWPGRVLLVESGDDRPATAAAAAARRPLREAYPRALVCTLAGAGHLIPMLRLEELAGVVKAFLAEQYSSPADIVEECAVEDHAHDAQFGGAAE